MPWLQKPEYVILFAVNLGERLINLQLGNTVNNTVNRFLWNKFFTSPRSIFYNFQNYLFLN